MKIIKKLEELSDVYGIADFDKNREELVDSYGEDICKYPYAIAIGHKMLEEIIEKIPRTYTDDELAQEYLDEYYNSHQRVAAIAKEILSCIEDEGYCGVILDVSGMSDELELKKAFSNKASANLAGIGWLGKNNLLTTLEYGPRLTWATILTDAPLKEYAGTPMQSQCGNCKICVKACPGNAIVDLPDPSKSYNPEKCGEFIFKRQDEGHPLACGMCLFICPYGNEKVEKIE